MENRKIELNANKTRVVKNDVRLYGKGDSDFADEVAKNLDSSYPYIDSTTLPLKNSVSVLLKKANEETTFEKDDFLTVPIYNSEVMESTQVGIAYHTAMQCLDYDSSEAFLARVQAALSDEEINVVDTQKVLNCRKTILEIAKSRDNGKLHKEQKFMMYIPYDEIFAESQIDDRILVQGIIDLFIEFDDEIILIDYKTNKTKDVQKLKKEYEMQMSLYKKSLCENYGKKVTAYLYSFSIENLIECGT